MNEEKPKQSLSFYKEYGNTIQWVVIAVVAVGLYLTGYHTPVIGKLQQALLWTGLIQPDIESVEKTNVAPSSELVLQSFDGSLTKLSDFQGKTVFLNVWATWCPPCRAEMPGIQQLYEETDKSKVKFVMLNLDDDAAKARQYMADNDYSFPVYRPMTRMPSEFNSSVIPTTYILAPDGSIVLSKQGMAKYNTEKFRKFLENQEFGGKPLQQ